MSRLTDPRGTVGRGSARTADGNRAPDGVLQSGPRRRRAPGAPARTAPVSTRATGGGESAAGAADVVVVSNRLPVRVVERDGATALEHSAGGLVSALSGISPGQAWVGWPGAVVAADEQEQLARTLAADGLLPVFLDAAEIEGFYDQICNETLWPLFHYFVGRLNVSEGAWEQYVSVNRRFAAAALRACGPRTRVWVHDFQLMLVPAMLRAARPDLAVGFFLHIPFPSSEIYRMLPAREQILDGLLGADYIAFQTGDDRRHFRSSCLRILGIDSSHSSIVADDRAVGLGVQPIGIDVAGFRAAAAEPATAAALAEIEQQYEGAHARPRRRAARLLEGHRPEAAGVRAVPRRQPGPRRDDHDAAGARPLPARERAVPRATRRDPAPHRRDQRALRPAGRDAGRVPVPAAPARGARGPLPARRRAARQLAPRRDEPRRAGVRVLPGGAGAGAPLERGAAPERAGRGREGAPRRDPRQSLGRRRHRRPARRGTRPRRGRAPAASGDDERPRGGARLRPLGSARSSSGWTASTSCGAAWPCRPHSTRPGRPSSPPPSAAQPTAPSSSTTTARSARSSRTRGWRPRPRRFAACSRSSPRFRTPTSTS